MRKLAFVVLFVTCALGAQDSPLVQVSIGEAPQSGDALAGVVTISSATDATLTDVDVEIVLTSTARDAALSGIGGGCTSPDPRRLRCRFATLFPRSRVAVFFTATPREGRLQITARATWTQNGQQLSSAPATRSYVLRRELVVTNTRDAGEGSLRAALEAANAAGTTDEVPLLIRFAIAEPPVNRAWSIRPLTPLPVITARDIRIAAPFGLMDTRVELDGALLGEGSGLELRGDGSYEIQGLVIGGFPWDGILVRRRGTAAAPSLISHCLIGLRVGSTPNPNRSRGITLDPPTSHVTLNANQTGHNARSGVFIAGATDVVVNAGRMDGNGASGIYIGPASRDIAIDTNYVGHNAHFGVAIARGARAVRLKNMFFENNRVLPIDHGLDGFSGHRFNGLHLPAPHIDSATYDPVAKVTTVTGSFDAPDAARQWKITLYNIQRVSEFGVRPETLVQGNRFTFTLAGEVFSDISVVADSAEPSEWSTSEFSNVVQVRR